MLRKITIGKRRLLIVVAISLLCVFGIGYYVINTPVQYYGHMTMMTRLLEEANASGHYVHCVTRVPERTILADAIIPFVDVTVCFDTVAEADAEIARNMQIIQARRNAAP